MLLTAMYQTNTPTKNKFKKTNLFEVILEQLTPSILDESRSSKEGKCMKVSPVFAVAFSS